MTRELSISVRDLFLDYELFEDRRAAIRKRLVDRTGTGRSVVRALEGVSFDIHVGESVGVIGSNGSGKSTLLAAVAGLLPPTAGDILVSDEPKLLGVGASLIPQATGYRNIWIGCLALGMRRDEIEDRMDEIAAFTDLGQALDRPLRTYSSGMKARLHFSIATAVQPRILLIDEALSVGDRAFRRKSSQRINRMLEDAGTLMLVSHSLGQIKNQCQRGLWIEGGHLLADGPVEEVIDKYQGAVEGDDDGD